jgi:hypothetical protein
MCYFLVIFPIHLDMLSICFTRKKIQQAAQNNGQAADQEANAAAFDSQSSP